MGFAAARILLPENYDEIRNSVSKEALNNIPRHKHENTSQLHLRSFSLTKNACIHHSCTHGGDGDERGFNNNKHAKI